MVMWKPTGPIRRLAARSTPSAIAPGRSKSPLLLSAKLSAQSAELNDISFDVHGKRGKFAVCSFLQSSVNRNVT